MQIASKKMRNPSSHASTQTQARSQARITSNSQTGPRNRPSKPKLRGPTCCPTCFLLISRYVRRGRATSLPLPPTYRSQFHKQHMQEVCSLVIIGSWLPSPSPPSSSSCSQMARLYWAAGCCVGNSGPPLYILLLTARTNHLRRPRC